MSRCSPAVVVLVLLSLVVAALAAQQAPPAAPTPRDPQLTFKVDVDYVEIDATVFDARGNPVRDLTQEDLHVFEDGRPQKVTVFSKVDIPIERPDPPLFRSAEVEADVRSNRRAFDGRVFVLVLDDLHTHFTRTPRVRAAATQFIDRYLGANDVAAVVTTGGARAGGQEFTNSRQALRRAVNAFAGQRLDSPTVERLRQAGAGRAAIDPNEAERAHKARGLMTSIKGLAEYLTGVRGRRKALVLFSEGIDYDITNAVTNRYASDITHQLRSAVASATRGNVSVYTIDPRGLTGFDDAVNLPAPPLDDPGALSGVMNDMRLAQDSLRVLAEETGGVAAVNRNDYRQTFERIIRDNSSYYVLGYYSDNTKRDGRFRSVDVKVRRPGLVVRARKGYTSPRSTPPAPRSPAAAGTSAELRDALNSPIPVSGLGLTVSAAPFRGASSRGVSVVFVVEIAGSRIQFREKDGKLANVIEVVTVPIDAGGKARDGTRDAITMTPRPETRDLIQARGLRIVGRIELPAGRYSLRVGAREEAGGATGSVPVDVDAPDFGKEPLSMSGLLLTSTGAASTPTARHDEQLKDVLPGAPTVSREFGRDETITLFAEVYDHIRQPHRVEIKTTATADDGKVVYTHTDTRGSDELKARGDGFGHLRSIALNGFAPGRYVLRVEARGLPNDGGTASRELEFSVR